MTDTSNDLGRTNYRATYLRELDRHSASNQLALQKWNDQFRVSGVATWSQPTVATVAIGAVGPWCSPSETPGDVYKVLAALATPDSGGADVVVTFYVNGSSFTTLTIPSGSTATVTGEPEYYGQWMLPGTALDTMQISVSYAGTTALGLVAHARWQVQ